MSDHPAQPARSGPTAPAAAPANPPVASTPAMVPAASRPLAPWAAWVLAVLVVVAAAGLGATLLALPAETPGLAPVVDAHLALSGAKNKVTAVLINFRGYDTVLEMAVLLLAVLGVRALWLEDPWELDEPGPVLTGLVHTLGPVLVLVAGYLLWAGGHLPGGAFQAGAVLGGLGVLLLAGRVLRPAAGPRVLERWLLVAGVGTFALVAAVMLLRGRLLELPPAEAKGWILLIESACTISIGVTLTMLFAGMPLGRRRDEATAGGTGP